MKTSSIAVLALAASISASAVAAGPKDDSGAQAWALVMLQTKIEAGMARRDPRPLDDAIDYDAILARGTAGADPGSDAVQGFSAGFRRALDKNSIGRASVAAMAPLGSYKLLRSRVVNGEMRVIFRLLGGASTGLNYHEYVVGPGPKPFKDVYIYTAGATFSGIVRRGFLSLLADSKRDLFDRITGANESEFGRHLGEIRHMQQLAAEQKYKEALATYETLPPSLQTDRSLMILRINWAREAGDDAYLRSMEAYQATYPGDPSADLIALDAYFMKRRFDEALRALDRIDKAIGDDPVLDAFRANVVLEEGKTAEAHAFAQKAVKRAPKLGAGYWALIAVSLARKDFKETARVLDEVEKKLGLRLGDLKGARPYAEFVRSPEYAAWMRSRR